MTEPATTPTAPATANLDAALRDFRLNAYYRNAQRDRSSFTSANERSALWFYQRPDGRVFLIQSQAPFVINQIQRAFGVNPVDGRFGPQTLAAIRADATRGGITLPNQLTAQVMAYALGKAFHRGVGTVALPARFELPNVDRPTLSSSRSTFLGAIDIASGQAATIDPGTGTVGQNLPPPAPSTTTTPAAPSQPALTQPAPSNTSTTVNFNPNLTAILGTPTQMTQPPSATAPGPTPGTFAPGSTSQNGGPPSTTSTPTTSGVGYMGASMTGIGIPQELLALFGQPTCPPCNTTGPHGQCKPKDPRDCTPPSAMRQAAPFIGAGIAVVTGLAAVVAAGASAKRQGYGRGE